MEKELTEKQEMVVVLTAQGISADKIAETTGVGRRTIFRWKKEKWFKSAVRDKVNSTIKDSLVRLQNLFGVAVSRLESLLTTETLTVKETLHIIQTLLAASQYYSENEIIDRIEELENKNNA